MSEDLISRQAAIDALDTGLWGVEWDKALATAMLKDLPSAQPEPHWIPCSERLPEPYESVLIYDYPIRKKEIAIGIISPDGLCYVDGCSGVKPIAWMPPPEYKENSDADICLIAVRGMKGGHRKMSFM